MLLAIFCFYLVGNSQTKSAKVKPRVLISTDIGGTDPDDFQSLIHLLMYANEISIEGLISSPYGPGRKTDFLPILELYEKDLPKLKKHANDFPDAQSLRNILALQVAELYKNRWQVELFFKWLKQHLKIKKIWGTNENAVRIQN